MDFSKLSQNDKLAAYGSAAVLVGGLVGYSYGLTVLAVLAAIAMLALVFLPQLSPSTNLPGSHGSLLLLVGGIAGVILLLALLLNIGTVFRGFDVRDLFFLIAVVGGVVMAWVGWQDFQAEGGKFQLGSASSATVPPATPSEAPPVSSQSGVSEPPPPAAPAAPEPPATEPPTYTTPAPSADAPADTDDEGRPSD
jgi:hypothetical protein